MARQNHLENNKIEISNKQLSSMSNPKEFKRIDKKYIISEIGSVLNFEKGILYTVKELLIRPGITIRRFILEDRTKLVKPVIFIIICSLFYTLLREIFHFEDDYVYVDNSNQSTSTAISNWIQNNYGYGNLIMGIFIAFWIKALFKKYGYNYYESLILLCFVMGIGMLILAVFGAIEGITKLKILQFGGIAFVVYSMWAIGQFFDQKKYLNYIKALIAYLLGLITFTIGTILLGNLIDFIK
tara:strand:+ start:72825 stop:73547 length:723 start_codon:yes stop_codon:yes gene_type:complete